ncbi:MAG: hypothetical protein Q7S84_02870 [bacterium]|nr:hypothetical protein [bacterium]
MNPVRSNKSTIILGALIALSAAFFMWALLGSKKQAPPAAPVVSPSTAPRTSGVEPQNTAGENLSAVALPLERKINNDGGVEVSVQPLDIQSNEWTFAVSMNTHAGDLDADLTKSAALTDKRGNIVSPIRWDGAPPGGHHREGTLVFQAMVPRPDSITFTVKDVGGVAERKFEWQLKGRENN